jgi:APA family basic amino acid/polyamine antiporter
LAKQKKLKKEIGLLGVYAIATGTTLSSGFFLLPGIAAQQVGPAVILAYMLATIPLVPAMFSMLELATAMPRAGGVYYFLDRTLGPLWGTVGGIGTWLALILKVSFSLIGMGAYIALFFPDLSIKPIAVTIAVLLALLNYFGSKKSENLQVGLLVGILLILISFIAFGLPELNLHHFKNFWDSGMDTLFATTGMVYISYVGITKVASLSEEVKNPERNLPLGVILAFITSIIIYGLGITVMVGVLPLSDLTSSLTPVADTAYILFGKLGVIFVTIAALFAFISVANAGTLSASRYPLALSRDKLVPPIFEKLNKNRVPLYALGITVIIILLILVFLDPTSIAKLASAFQLLMFLLVCLAVIVMRESKLEAYDPGYKSPFYPWMQIIGIIAPLFLVSKMGFLPILFSSALIVLAIVWYLYYGRKRVKRTGAIFHVFERLGRQRNLGLESELRGILKEKGLRKEDPFDEIVARSVVVDISERKEFEEIVEKVSKILAKRIPHTSEEIKAQFMEGTRIGATPVTHNVALPHLRIDGLLQPEMILVRAQRGVHIHFTNPITDKEEAQIVAAIFFLISPLNNPSQHLRILARIAGRIDEESFEEEWKNAKSADEIRQTLTHDEKWISLVISGQNQTADLIGKKVMEANMPKNSLIAVIKRHGKSLIPKGDTVIKEEDRLTIIGDPESIRELEMRFGSNSFNNKQIKVK